MDLKSIEFELSELFSDLKIMSDFFDFLSKNGMSKGPVFECFIDNVVYRFNACEKIEVITRSIQFDRIPSSVEARVLVAVGGVVSEENGVCVAGRFFAKLYYGDLMQPNRVEMDSCQFSL